jgi:hypothetical protein
MEVPVAVVGGGERSGFAGKELAWAKRGAFLSLLAMGWRVSLHLCKRQADANSLMGGEFQWLSDFGSLILTPVRRQES